MGGFATRPRLVRRGRLGLVTIRHDAAAQEADAALEGPAGRAENFTASETSKDAGMSYAVLFKIYFVDEFVIRQLGRLKSRVGHGDVYVIADETHGELGPIPHDKVIRATEAEMRQAGFENGASDQAMFWYNADYSLYRLFDQYPDYDHYVTIEYDAVVNGDFDQIISAVAASGYDFVGEKVSSPASEWAWTKSCDGIYAPEAVRGYLNAIAMFSRRAISLLRDRAGSRYRPGFVPERSAGFRSRKPTFPRNSGFRASESASFPNLAIRRSTTGGRPARSLI